MREIQYRCPCGSVIDTSQIPLTCNSCGAIFEVALVLLLTKRGRDDSLQEGTAAKVLTVESPHEQRPIRIAETIR